jgi:Co/Zn/Cd efflux system component
MSCDCQMEAKDQAQRQVLVTLLAINGAMFVVEIVAGLVADSSGVIADSLDMLADALVYGISLYAIGRSASIKVRAARSSGWFQIALAASIVLDVVRRAVFGSEPASLLMLVVASCALCANAYCLKLLAQHRQGEVHLRASWIFTRSDVIANAGVIVAALLVSLTQTRWPDLIVGAAIAGVVIKGGLSILSEARQAERPERTAATLDVPKKSGRAAYP